MILTGSTIGNIKHAKQMAAHLFKDENEKILVEETISGGQDRCAVEKSLVDMQSYTLMTKGSTGIFHVAISPREHERLTPEQQDQALQMIEKKFELEGQTRIQVSHIKDGRKHTHVFWSTVDLEACKLKTPNLYKYKRKLQEIGDEMDKEFGHEPTPRTPDEKSILLTHFDRMADGRKSKGQQTSQERKEEISQLWRESKTGQEFLTKAREEGYEIAKGDKAAFVLLDREGVATSLAKDLPKLVKTKDVRERLGSEHKLASVAQARENQKARLQGKPEPEYEYDRDAQNAAWEEKIFQAGIDHDKIKTQEERKARHIEWRKRKEIAANRRQERRHKKAADNRPYFEVNNQNTPARQEFNAEARDGAPGTRKTKEEREQEEDKRKALVDKLRREKRHEKAARSRKDFKVGQGSNINKEFNAENDNQAKKEKNIEPDIISQNQGDKWDDYLKKKRGQRKLQKDKKKKKGRDIEI